MRNTRNILTALLLVVALAGSAIAAPVATNAVDGNGKRITTDYEVGATKASAGSGNSTGGK